MMAALHNTPATQLVDELGELRARINELQAREKVVRDALVSAGVGIIDGDEFTASISEAVRWTLDSKAVKAEMSDAWYDARCRQSVVTTVKVTSRQKLAA